MAKLQSTNPAKDYEILGKVNISTNTEIRDAVNFANKRKTEWKEFKIKSRIALLKPILTEFTKRQEEFALLITNEIGKPIPASRKEVEDSLSIFQWFMDNAERALEDEILYKDGQFIHKIIYEPHGTTAVITPWNYPFGMAILGIVPNLIAGNTVIFKTSEECPLIGKLIEEIMDNSDLPKGVFSEIYGGGEVGERLARSDVNLIYFTGSTTVGKRLYKIAAEKFINVGKH